MFATQRLPLRRTRADAPGRPRATLFHIEVVSWCSPVSSFTPSTEGSDAVGRLIEDLYEYIAASEPPAVRSLRLTVDSQLEIIRRLQRRLKRVEERLAHEQRHT